MQQDQENPQQLLSLSARSFEFFAGEFLVYVGLEAVSVTRYIGDGGIDAHGKLVVGQFRIPIGVQVKRHRNNVQRPDIDRFIGALSGRFSEGMFMTTADYTSGALQKASTSIPRVLTLNGDQVVSIMVEHRLGLKISSLNAQKLDIDPDYFVTFETMRNLLVSRVRETPQHYSPNTSASDSDTSLDEQTIALKWKQEFLDFAKSRNLTKSYKPVMLKAFFKLVDREGKVQIDDLVKEFRDYYVERANAGQPLERGASPLSDPTKPSDTTIKRLIITYPLERFLIKNFMEYSSEEGILRIAPQLWQELRYYEVVDTLKSTDEQIKYYEARHDN